MAPRRFLGGSAQHCVSISTTAEKREKTTLIVMSFYICIACFNCVHMYEYLCVCEGLVKFPKSLGKMAKGGLALLSVTEHQRPVSHLTGLASKCFMYYYI